MASARPSAGYTVCFAVETLMQATRPDDETTARWTSLRDKEPPRLVQPHSGETWRLPLLGWGRVLDQSKFPVVSIEDATGRHRRVLWRADFIRGDGIP